MSLIRKMKSSNPKIIPSSQNPQPLQVIYHHLINFRLLNQVEEVSGHAGKKFVFIKLKYDIDFLRGTFKI